MGVGQMDCRNWDEDLYRDAILQERETVARTVFRTAFAPNPSPNPNSDHIVAVSSDGAIASYSISSCLELGCGISRAQNWLVAEPQFLVQGHDGPAYDVKFYDDSLLLSCGDDGRIRGWNWKEILDSDVSMQGDKMKPVLDLVNPQHKGPWGALSPIPENNAIAVDSQNGSIYAAAGDSCAYCWDMEKGVVKMVLKGHSDYLHCIVSCSLSNQVRFSSVLLLTPIEHCENLMLNYTRLVLDVILSVSCFFLIFSILILSIQFKMTFSC
ncbi:hypothetical protein ACS0TY_021425 [Phlomoides rotata]